MKQIFSLSLVAALGIGSSGAWASNVAGKIAFKGQAPKGKAIQMAADPNCMKLNSKPVTTESVVVNGNGTLKNVFVWVKEGVSGSHAAPTTPIVMDQKGCQYTPHVFGVMVGQNLEIRNSDPTLHNIHFMPKTNPQINVGMPVQNMKITKKFDKAEIGAKVKCDVHPWMKAYANVVEHPFFSVSGDTGSFDIQGLPAGTYTLAAWHEEYGTQEQKITVVEGKPTAVDFTFDGTKTPAK